MIQLSKKRLLSLFKNIPFVFFFFTLFVSDLYSADAIIGSGSTVFGTQRKIVYNPSWGYWVFFTDDSGEPVWSYSPTGTPGSWSAPQKIFSGTGGSGYGNAPSVWYNAVSSYVFVVVGPSGNGELSNADMTMHVRRGRLQSDGSIDWAGSYYTPDLDEGTTASNADEDMINEANTGASPSITQNSNGYVFIYTPGGESSAGGYDDYTGLIANSNSINNVDIQNIHVEIGGRESDRYLSFSVVVPHGGTATEVWAFSESAQGRDITLYRVNESLTSTQISATFFNNALNTGSAVLDDRKNVSAVVDSGGRLHAIVSRITDGLIRYRSCSSANGVGTEITISGTWQANQVSIAVIHYPSTSQSKLFVVFESTDSNLMAIESALFTPGNTPASWGSPYLLVSDGVQPVLSYSTQDPYPLGLLYTDVGGNVKFKRVPISSNPNPTFSSASPSTVGIGAGIEDATTDPTYDIQINGGNFLTNPNPGVSFERNGVPVEGITITSITYVSSNRIYAHIKVDQSVSAGPVDIVVSNYDAREVYGVGVVTITVPSANITYPVEPVYYSSGIAGINGTASFSPNVGQTLLNSQLRITRTDNGYEWNGTGYVNPAINGEQWLGASGGANWNYSSLPNNSIAQPDGVELKLEGRGRTNDRGFSLPSSPVIFKIDKTPPTLSINKPAANSSYNFIDSFDGSVSDLLSGVKFVQIQLIDSFDNIFGNGNDLYWDGVGSWLGSTTWFYVLKIPEVIPTNFTCSGGECSNKIVNWQITQSGSLKLPAFTDGRQYQFYLRAGDMFWGVDQHSSTSSARNFYYDITPPTATLINPPTLMNDYNNPSRIWLNNFSNLVIRTIDNVKDNVIGNRTVYYCVYEQGGIDKIGSSCASGSPNYVSSVFAPSSDPYDFNINVSTNYKTGFWYGVKSYVIDAAQNSTGTAASPLINGYFYYDNLPPNQWITYPSTGAYGLNSIVDIKGTTDKDKLNAGINHVEYRLEYPPLYKWDSTSKNWVSQTDAIWNIATTTTTDYSVWLTSEVYNNGKWISGEEYTLIVRSVDNAGNYTLSYSTVVFKYDKDAPLTSVTSPSSGARYSANFTNISGTAVDQPDTTRQAGLNQICIGIQRASDGKWWNGTALGWQATRNDPCQAGLTSWSHQSMGGFWSGVPNVDKFDIYSWSQDNVNKPDSSYRNIESSTTLKRSFVYEILPPSSTVTAPVNNQYFSVEPGYELGNITAYAVDNPTSGFASGGSISNMQIEVRDEQLLTCWNGTDFSGTCGTAGTWKDMSQVVGSTYGYNTSALMTQAIDGREYRIRVRGLDDTLDETNSPKPNIESFFENGRNEIKFRVDKGTPSATIQIPNQYNVYALTQISGIASDTGSGVKHVHVAYYSVTAGKWWNPLNGNWELGDSINPPPDSAFIEASTTTSNPVNWVVTGSSIPVFSNNQKYRIFARAMDKVGNKTSFPGQSNYTQPPVQSSYIEIQKLTPMPESYITIPAAGVPYYRPTDLNTITGTLEAATTVQIRIINETNGTVWISTSNTWVSTSVYLAGCSDDTYVVGQSTCGFFGVDSITGSDWTKDVNGIWPAGTNKFSIKVRAAADATLETTPYEERFFYIDGDDPSIALTEPNAEYEKDVPSIYGVATDIGDGIVTKVEVRISTASQSSFWDGSNWVSVSTWLSANPVDGFFNSNNEQWILNTGLPVFENDKTYEVQVRVTDKAGRVKTYPSPYLAFTIDKTSPTAQIQIPNGSVVLNDVPYIKGVASDNGKNSKVKIAIQQLGSPALWFDGNNFNVLQSSPSWIEIQNGVNGFLSSNATSWIYSPASLNTAMAGGYKYVLLIRAEDVAGNIQDTFALGISSITITVDRYPPTTSITLPSDDGDGVSGRYKSSDIGKSATNSRFYGVATDSYYSSNNAGAEKTQISLSYLFNGDTYYWLGPTIGFSSGAYAESNRWQDASGSGAWLYVPDVSWPAGDREYRLEAKSMDATRKVDGSGEGNWQVVYTTVNFIVDDMPPSVTITSPTASALKTIDRVYVDVSENLAGFNYGEVRISTGTAPKYYYDGSGWTTDANTWLNGTKLGPTSYYYQIPSSILKDDTVYTIEARANDYAGNVTTIYSTYTFTYDITGPQITITYPIDNAVYSGIKLSTPITGNTVNTQTSANTGVSTVSISVADLDAAGGAKCYNGTNGFDQSCPKWINVTAPFSPWSYTANLPYINDHRYQIQTKATDIAGNDGNTASVTIKYDIEEPTSTITYPSGGYVITITSVTGVANDEKYGTRSYEAKLGTHTVKVAIKRITAPSGWWDELAGNFSSATPVWYEANNATTTTPNQWVYNFSGGLNAYLTNPANQDVQYRIVNWAYDLADNREYGPTNGEPLEADIPGYVGRVIRHDNTKPTTQITMPNALYHNSLPTIQGTASDNIGITKVEFRVYDESLYKCYDPNQNPVWYSCSGPNFAPWINSNITIYTTSASWNYSIGDSTWTASTNHDYTIMARSYDIAGNMDTVYSTFTFKFDDIPPQSAVTIPSSGSYINTLPITVGGNSNDPNNGSGINNISLKLINSDGKWWSGASWENTEQLIPVLAPYASWSVGKGIKR
ncbi:MAG TPA: hypothetical protein PLD81_06050 [Elusimicrobiales bacterium]|nr:hypothetical protein [Elusimicrobiales bacterium]